MNKKILALVVIFACLWLAGCENDGHLRGKVSPSADGKTYFAVLDDAGGQCGPVLLDGVIWAHPIGEYFKIEPGEHTIKCGAEISFIVPAGIMFGFDYWGP
jgi:hypothetical protein